MVPTVKTRSLKQRNSAGPRIGRQRMLGHSIEMKGWARQNRGLLVPAFSLLRKNFVRLQSGWTVTDPTKKIQIQRKHTGSHSGAQNWGVFRITIRGREFFAKVSSPTEIPETEAKMREWEELLSMHHHRAGPFRLEILKPHVVYAGKQLSSKITSPFALLVYDFLGPEHVTLAADAPEPLKSQIRSAFKEMDSWHSELKPGWGNTFVQPKQKKLVLFDLTG